MPGGIELFSLFVARDKIPQICQLFNFLSRRTFRADERALSNKVLYELKAVGKRELRSLKKTHLCQMDAHRNALNVQPLMIVDDESIFRERRRPLTSVGANKQSSD